MSYRITSMSLILLFFFVAGCQKAENMQTISQITYVSESGTILPELQWHEEFIIRTDSVTFMRSGNAGASDVNTGSWQVTYDAAKVSALFETLKSVNFNKITRIDPIDQPEGGGNDSYVIKYSNGKTWSLDYNFGTTYTNGEWVSQPVQEFIKELQLPSGAESRYKL